MEAVKLHIKSHIFSTKYVLCTYPPPPRTKKFIDIIRTRKKLFLYPLLYTFFHTKSLHFSAFLSYIFLQ